MKRSAKFATGLAMASLLAGIAASGPAAARPGHHGGGGVGGGGGAAVGGPRLSGGAGFVRSGPSARIAPAIRPAAPSFAPGAVVRGGGKHGGGHHHHRRHVRGGVYFATPFYGYYDYDDCGWLRRRAIETGSRYWWRRYQECRDR